MKPIKKALILSLALHLVGLLGGEFLLKRARLKNKKVIYPIHLIEMAESSPKPIVREPPPKKLKQLAPALKKPKPKVVKKEVPKKTQEPKKGVPIRKDEKKEPAPKKNEQKQVKEDTIRPEIKKDEEKKVSNAIEEIKKALALKEKERHSEVSKKFIERQLQIYAAEIDRLIKNNWSFFAFSKDMGDFEAIVVIRLNNAGELADARLEKPSGSHPFDESTLRAIKKASPFPPPPPLDPKEDKLEFEIRFNSNQL